MSKLINPCKFLTLASLLSVLFAAKAHTIEIVSGVDVLYELNNFSTDQYEYTYTVTNNDPSAEIESLRVYFDDALYDNLVVTQTPVGWTTVVEQPDSILGTDGIVNVVALIDALTPGESLAGLSIGFDWLDSRLFPGDQMFEVTDTSANIYTDGTTMQVTGGPVGIPAPPNLAVFLLGMGLISLKRRSKAV